MPVGAADEKGAHTTVDGGEVNERKAVEAERAGIVHRVAESSAVAPHPLIGTGVHFKDQYGRVQDRAAIVAVIPSNNAAVGDLVLLRYFGRLRAEPPTQRLIPLAELSSSDRWVLYRSVAEMIWAEAEKEAQEAAIFDLGRLGLSPKIENGVTNHRRGSLNDPGRVK